MVEYVWWTGSPQPHKTHLSLLAKFLANPVVDDSWHGYPRASHTIGAKNYNCKLDIHLHLAMLFQSRSKSMDSASKHVECEGFHETSMSQIYRILNISSCWKIPKLLTKSKSTQKNCNSMFVLRGFGGIPWDSLTLYTRLDEQLGEPTVLQDTWQVVHWPTPRWAYLRAGKKSSYVTSWGEICQTWTNMLDSPSPLLQKLFHQPYNCTKIFHQLDYTTNLTFFRTCPPQKTNTTLVKVHEVMVAVIHSSQKTHKCRNIPMNIGEQWKHHHDEMRSPRTNTMNQELY